METESGCSKVKEDKIILKGTNYQTMKANGILESITVKESYNLLMAELMEVNLLMEFLKVLDRILNMKEHTWEMLLTAPNAV